MLLTLLQFFATKFLVLALHLEAGSFPKPLSAREEVETFAALRAGDPTARETLIRHNRRLGCMEAHRPPIRDALEAADLPEAISPHRTVICLNHRKIRRTAKCLFHK